MTVKIVTDSVADVPSQVAEELRITVIPILVRFDTETFRDGIDLTTDEFYYKLEHGKIMPASAVASPVTYAEVYDKLAEETDEILFIALSRKLSASYNTALQGIELMKRKCRVEVIDSLWVIMGQGLMAIAAAKAANSGASLDEVVAITRNNISRTDIRVAFDTLEYLKRGGRIGAAQALLGSMLRVNPIITIKDGVVHPAARERSRAKAIGYLYNFAMSFSHIDEMAVEHATTPDEAEMLAEQLSSKFPKERMYRAKVGCVVGTHVGPHVLAVSVLGDK